jgi:hypothetical protein
MYAKKTAYSMKVLGKASILIFWFMWIDVDFSSECASKRFWQEIGQGMRLNSLGHLFLPQLYATSRCALPPSLL